MLAHLLLTFSSARRLLMNYFQALTYLSYASFPARVIYLFRFHSTPTHHHLQSGGKETVWKLSPDPSLCEVEHQPAACPSTSDTRGDWCYTSNIQLSKSQQEGWESGIGEWLQQHSIIQIIQQVLHRPASASHSKEPICYWWLQKWFYLSPKPWAHQNSNSSLNLETWLRGSPSMSATTISKVSDYYDRERKKSLSP